MKKIKPVLRIELEGDNLLVKVLSPKRFKLIGFGTFLSKTKTGEISITKSALAAILKQPYRSGEQAMEIFSNGADRTLAWGSPRHYVLLPLDRVSRHKGSNWFKECCVVEGD
jgi:hypothetical protein